MIPGMVSDTIDHQNYPDVLSLNYNNFKLSQTPRAIVLDDNQIIRFWALVNDLWGSCENDDILLTLNGISHKNFLHNGSPLIVPEKSDIKSSFS